jgi:hypothetical protein
MSYKGSGRGLLIGCGLFVLLLWTSTWSYSQAIRISVIDGDSLVLVPIERIVRANILFAQCDSVAVEKHHLQGLLDNSTRLVNQLELTRIDLTRIVNRQKELVLLEKEKNKYYIHQVEKERHKRMYWQIGLGAGIILALFI